MSRSPAGQPYGSPRSRKIARQTPIEATLQTELGAFGSTVSSRTRHDFDPQAFLATISEGRKVVLFPRKQTIFAQGDTAGDTLGNCAAFPYHVLSIKSESDMLRLRQPRRIYTVHGGYSLRRLRCGR